jgi:hypothetical protein
VHREVRAGRLAARRFAAPSMRAMLVVATAAHRPVARLAKAVQELLRAEVRELAEAEVLRGTTRGLGQRMRGAATRA